MKSASFLVWGTLICVLIFCGTVGALSLRQHDLPDDFGAVPDFKLMEKSGRIISLADLHGSYWVADFIFTQCSGSCPLLTSRMANLSLMIPDLQLVSIGVDPARDSLQVLRRYADAHRPTGIDADRWLFLTGTRDQLHHLVTGGFHLSIAELPPGTQAPEGEWVTHSDRLVLVDPEGRIRGYYHGTEEDSLQRLTEDLGRLRNADRL